MPIAKTIMLVFGTRPEAIKMVPVLRALQSRPELFRPLVCVTAQHREMLDQVLETFGIVPEIDLDLMRERQNLNSLSAAVLQAMQKVLAKHRPDLVLVHGDTTTTMASTLAAYHLGIPVGHVEAGLRSGSLEAPFPEELNRRVVDMIAAYRFAPTEASRENLVAEGCDPASIVVTGNTVVDALKQTVTATDEDEVLHAAVERRLNADLPFAWRAGGFVIVTSHRRENFPVGLESICASIAALSVRFPTVRWVFPVHRNPAVCAIVQDTLGQRDTIHLLDPLDYAAFLHLLRHCHCVLTDSGGLQEEGAALGKPVLLMRDVTERQEAVSTGGVRLVGTSSAAIVAGVARLLDDRSEHDAMARAPNPFGDGTAGERIADYLERALFTAERAQ